MAGDDNAGHKSYNTQISIYDNPRGLPRWVYLEIIFLTTRKEKPQSEKYRTTRFLSRLFPSRFSSGKKILEKIAWGTKILEDIFGVFTSSIFH